MNNQTTKKRKNTGKTILAVMSSLPDINIFTDADYTIDLMYEFINQKACNVLLGEFLSARFMGGGNTAFIEKTKGNINESTYICIVEMANYLESCFNLTQTFWQYIKKELVTVYVWKRYPKSDLELFKFMLEEMFNNKFRERINGCRYTKKDAERAAKLEIKHLNLQLQKSNNLAEKIVIDDELNQIEAELKSIDEKSKTIPNKWHNFIFDVFIKYSTDDELLQIMLTRHINLYIDMKIRLENTFEHDRKHEQKLKPIIFIDGNRYYK